jgi:hypothetical protein
LSSPYSKFFSGLDENPTDLASTIDKIHKIKSKDSWRDITLKRLGTPTTVKAYIQHILKENSKIWENNSDRFKRIIQAKMYPKR